MSSLKGSVGRCLCMYPLCRLDIAATETVLSAVCRCTLAICLSFLEVGGRGLLHSLDFIMTA